MLTQLFFAALAGLLTSLSPCVITALPFVINSSLSENKKGPLFLVFGLISSFTLLGVLFAATTKLGFVSQHGIKHGAAFILLVVSLFFIFPKLSDWLGGKLSFVSAGGHNILTKLKSRGLLGQFLVGFFLGAIWSPCIGPTLGLALTLIAKEQEILKGVMIMLTFSIFASLPLLIIAYISGNFVKKYNQKIRSLYKYVKLALGLIILLYSLAVLTATDIVIEGYLLDLLPESVFDLITSY